jgi:hypothetical protein
LQLQFQWSELQTYFSFERLPRSERKEHGGTTMLFHLRAGFAAGEVTRQIVLPLLAAASSARAQAQALRAFSRRNVWWATIKPDSRRSLIPQKIGFL